MDRGVAVTGGREELLRTHAGTLDDDVGLGARPLERLLDLGPGGVRELRGLVARLLGETVSAALGLAQLGGRVAVCLREDLAGLLARGAEDLGALPLGFLADARDLGLLLLELHLLLADLLLGAADLLRSRVLGIPLDRVGELGRGAHDVQRVHADCVARGLRDGALRRGLEDAQVGLEGRDMAPEGVERLLDLGAIEAVRCARKVLEAR